MRTFVTGGSGYLGRNLLSALVARGISVRALVRSEEAAQKVQALGAQPILGTLEHRETLKEGMAGCDVLFHAAALTSARATDAEFHRANVLGTETVLAAARDARIQRMVHVSTEAVLADGRPLLQVDESHPLPKRPFAGYPATKAQAEQLVLQANGPGFTTVVVRPRFIWGADDTAFLPQLIDAIRTKRFRWVDGGRYLTSTCHVANVCEGMLLAAERGPGGEVYFLTDGAPVELRSFLTLLLETQGIKAEVGNIPFQAARAAAHLGESLWRALVPQARAPALRLAVYLLGREVTLNDDKARRELGYAGRVTHQQGLDALRQAGPAGQGAMPHRA
uniref:4-hydroxy-2-methyl-3-oxo-4-farnesyl-3,4-dihydroquinoline-1-oxide ketoreductase n=1 Tax=Stigmatella aurantiaca TaxID=41 RepID=AUAH_STIAU|nr:RecName: Full=Aurachin B dehydrogenase [Stigmatella aurantiaca]CCD27750.1 similarity to hydroxysteroid dehydrogenase/isomerase [Stigmatella aurantiaca Sg a15]